MRMRQYGLLKCHRGSTEAFSVNCLRSVPAFAGCFLDLNDVYWALRSTNMFFKVSRCFYDESEFIRVHTKNCNHFSRTFQGLFKDHIRFSR